MYFPLCMQQARAVWEEYLGGPGLMVKISSGQHLRREPWGERSERMMGIRIADTCVVNRI